MTLHRETFSRWYGGEDALPVSNPECIEEFTVDRELRLEEEAADMSRINRPRNRDEDSRADAYFADDRWETVDETADWDDDEYDEDNEHSADLVSQKNVLYENQFERSISGFLTPKKVEEAAETDYVDALEMVDQSVDFKELIDDIDFVRNGRLSK